MQGQATLGIPSLSLKKGIKYRLDLISRKFESLGVIQIEKELIFSQFNKLYSDILFPLVGSLNPQAKIIPDSSIEGVQAFWLEFCSLRLKDFLKLDDVQGAVILYLRLHLKLAEMNFIS